MLDIPEVIVFIVFSDYITLQCHGTRFHNSNVDKCTMGTRPALWLPTVALPHSGGQGFMEPTC